MPSPEMATLLKLKEAVVAVQVAPDGCTMLALVHVTPKLALQKMLLLVEATMRLPLSDKATLV